MLMEKEQLQGAVFGLCSLLASGFLQVFRVLLRFANWMGPNRTAKQAFNSLVIMHQNHIEWRNGSGMSGDHHP